MSKLVEAISESQPNISRVLTEAKARRLQSTVDAAIRAIYEEAGPEGLLYFGNQIADRLDEADVFKSIGNFTSKNVRKLGNAVVDNVSRKPVTSAGAFEAARLAADSYGNAKAISDADGSALTPASILSQVPEVAHHHLAQLGDFLNSIIPHLEEETNTPVKQTKVIKESVVSKGLR